MQRIKKEGSDGRKALRSRAYTPSGIFLSAVVVGADPGLPSSFFEQSFHVFELRVLADRPTVFFGQMMK